MLRREILLCTTESGVLLNVWSRDVVVKCKCREYVCHQLPSILVFNSLQGNSKGFNSALEFYKYKILKLRPHHVDSYCLIIQSSPFKDSNVKGFITLLTTHTCHQITFFRKMDMGRGRAIPFKRKFYERIQCRNC